MTTFETWYSNLNAIAKMQGAGYLIAGAEDHRDAFEDGLSPDEELVEQLYAATSDGADFFI